MRVELLGLMPYQAAWDRQLEVHAQVCEGAEDTLLVVEHPPVLTLGVNFHEDNLLLSPKDYEKQGIEVIRTDRGGDVTSHGPGQLVLYPIFNVRHHGADVHKWMRDLEEVILQSLTAFGLVGRRFPPHSGVWIGDKKVAAIGVKLKRWVNLHGIAVNCNNDLRPFGLIIPCGIHGYSVTGLSQELGREVTTAEAVDVCTASFRDVFGRSS